MMVTRKEARNLQWDRVGSFLLLLFVMIACYRFIISQLVGDLSVCLVDAVYYVLQTEPSFLGQRTGCRNLERNSHQLH